MVLSRLYLASANFVRVYLYPALILVFAYHVPIWLLGMPEKSDGFREVYSVEQQSDWPSKLNYQQEQERPDFNMYQVRRQVAPLEMERFGDMVQPVASVGGDFSDDFFTVAQDVLRDGIANRFETYKRYYNTAGVLWEAFTETKTARFLGVVGCRSADYFLDMPVSRLMDCPEPGSARRHQSADNSFVSLDNLRRQIRELSS